MDENKTYEFKGTVTISTDEYRDLITNCCKFEEQRDNYRNKFWDEQAKNKELESSLAITKRELEKAKEFLASREEIRTAYRLYLVNVDEVKNA